MFFNAPFFKIINHSLIIADSIKGEQHREEATVDGKSFSLSFSWKTNRNHRTIGVSHDIETLPNRVIIYQALSRV